MERRTFTTAPDVARMAGLSDATLRVYLERGLISGAWRTPGGHWRLPVTALDELTMPCQQLSQA